jgi:hypothetical protein
MSKKTRQHKFSPPPIFKTSKSPTHTNNSQSTNSQTPGGMSVASNQSKNDEHKPRGWSGIVRSSNKQRLLEELGFDPRLCKDLIVITKDETVTLKIPGLSWDQAVELMQVYWSNFKKTN